MKKRLESELISIAHRILKLKNKSEVDQLYKETQKLYETLSVLKFYQDNFESVKSDVAEDVLEEKLEQSNKVDITPEPVTEVKEAVVEAVAEVQEETAIEEAQPETEEEIEEALTEESMVSEEAEETVEETLEEEPALEEEEEVVAEEKPAFQPIFELEAEEEEEEIASEEKLEDHIGKYADPIFEKINEVSLFPSDSSDSEQAKQTKEEETKKEEEAPKPAAVNDNQSKTIAIGLNDRIGFVQHLFNDSNEDFNRVISQLNTFDTFEEAKNFINEMVIPDYGYWVGVEDYMERFMTIVEKKFE